MYSSIQKHEASQSNFKLDSNKKWSSNHIKRYTFIGILFGICFPLCSWVIDFINFDIPFSFQSLEFIHQRNIIHFIVDTAPLVLGFVFHIMGRLAAQQIKEKNEIAHAYKVINRSHTLINQSITYARQIQDAMLPTESELQNCFQDYFYFNSPRDIIGGDAIWCSKEGNNIKLAVIDCTGHGVPGAMMTMAAHLLIRKVTHENKSSNPAEILTQLDIEFKKSLHQTEKVQENSSSSDLGMDISFISYNKESKTVLFSGAHQSLYIQKNNGELVVLKGTSRGIGCNTKHKRPFLNYEFNINDKERLFLFSDGLVDQFDELNKTKFSSKQLKEILNSHQNSSIKEIEIEIKSKWLNWKGNSKQTDDCTFFGFEV